LAHACIGWQKCGLKPDLEQEFYRDNYKDYLFANESKNDLKCGTLKMENVFLCGLFKSPKVMKLYILKMDKCI